MNNNSPEQINLLSKESQDSRSQKAGAFSPELDQYTPLMLTLCSEFSSLEVVKILLAAKANFKVHDKLTGDNILHLAVRWSTKIEIIEYLVRSLSSDLLFERNIKGETPLSISNSLKNTRATELLE